MDKYLFICFSIFQFPILVVNLLQLTQTATELIATQNYYLSIFVIKKKKKKYKLQTLKEMQHKFLINRSLHWPDWYNKNKVKSRENPKQRSKNMAWIGIFMDAILDRWKMMLKWLRFLCVLEIGQGSSAFTRTFQLPTWNFPNRHNCTSLIDDLLIEFYCTGRL